MYRCLSERRNAATRIVEWARVKSGTETVRGTTVIPAGRSIDRSSYEPAYVQLVNILRAAIASGQYQAGDQLPTESELCAAYDVSPMTVRRGIGILLDQGAVSTTRGRGTFVQPLRLATATFDLGEFHALLADETVTVRMIEARVLPAGPRAAGKLGLADGTRVVSIRRMLLRSDEPLVYHRESLVYDPTRPIVEAELDVTALRDMFEGGAGSGPKRGELILHASALTETEAPQLQQPEGSHAWVLEHIFYGYDEKPLSWGRFVCRGDLLHFRAQVGAPAPEESRSTKARR
jgi:DNA-binding GntR family transcriptional regulator